LIQLYGDTPQLWLIDHEKLLLAPRDNNDMDMLHRMIKYYKPALAACRLVSRISDNDIEKSLSGIPALFWQTGDAFDNQKDAAEYFNHRLRAWKNVFGSTRK
jgi:hypothetical protein